MDKFGTWERQDVICSFKNIPLAAWRTDCRRWMAQEARAEAGGQQGLGWWPRRPKEGIGLGMCFGGEGDKVDMGRGRTDGSRLGFPGVQLALRGQRGAGLCQGPRSCQTLKTHNMKSCSQLGWLPRTAMVVLLTF